MTDDPFFLSVQAKGFSLIWEDGEPTQRGFKKQKLDAGKTNAFREQHERLITQVGCTSWVRSARSVATTAEYLHQVFAIWQGTKYRSLKIMNQSLKERRFKMTGTAVWKSIITKDMYMASIDIKDAYLHIPVGKESRRFMRYEWEGNIFELKALPFGLAQAPYVFTRMLQPLLQKWRKELDIAIIAWLDDIIMGHMSRSHLRVAIQQILDDLSDVGLAVNIKPGKSTLYPIKQLIWCGLLWDTLNMTVYIPKERRQNVAKAAGKLLRRATKGKVLTREVAVVVGKITATTEAVLPQRCHSMALVRELGGALRKTSSYDSMIFLSQEALDQLRWWTTELPKWNGRSWAQPAPLAAVLTTDASPRGYGATLRILETVATRQLRMASWGRRSIMTSQQDRVEQEQRFKELEPDSQPEEGRYVAPLTTLPNLQVLKSHKDPLFYTETAGLFTEKEGLLWQNEREALGVKLSLQAFEKQLRILRTLASPREPIRVLIRQDNQSVVAAIRRQGSTKAGIGRIVEAFMREAFENGILLQSAWIPGLTMEADQLSRSLALRDTADWEVSPTVFNRICEFMGLRPNVDLFASRTNTQVSHFYSLNPDPEALDFDALSEDKDWGSFTTCYAAPPTRLIPKMLRKIASSGARVIAFLPKWPSAPWWSTILRLARGSQMLEIKLSHSTIIKGQGINPLLWPGKTAVAVLLRGDQRTDRLD